MESHDAPKKPATKNRNPLYPFLLKCLKMNIVKMLFLVAFCATTVSTTFGQERFTNCAAAYLNNKLVVNEYSPEGHCELSKSATGELTVQTMNDTTPTGKTSFKIAIRDGNTKTLFSFSNKTYQQIDLKAVLDKCKPGDAVVLLTTGDQYALPHNEILVK